MDKDFIPVRTTYYTNHDVIKNIMKLYNIDQFDLDCTYSRGLFWKGLPSPKNKTDLTPVTEDTIKANSEDLPFGDESMRSIMYDPPFGVGGKDYKTDKEGSSLIPKRFQIYTTFQQLTDNYYNTLKELYRVTTPGGLVVMKSQDVVSGGKNHFTHVMAMNMAHKIGFYPRDLFILLAKGRIHSFGGRWKVQHHARKHHSYFWVFEKTKPKVKYLF